MLHHERCRTWLRALVGAAALVGALLGRASAHEPAAPPLVRYETTRVAGLDIFYREAGVKSAPVLLLLHGFPSSSFMFRDLIPRLATRYRVIAPDYPGFGQSSFPSREEFRYTFENLATVLSGFTRALHLDKYVIYIQDYGAPVGLRMALQQPERIAGIIVQNGNAYEEGFNADSWAPLRAYWREPTAARRERLRGWLTPEGVRQQYVAGVPASRQRQFSPDTWTLDWALLDRPGAVEAQLDLFGDYASNVALYPRFHQFFRTRRPPTLIVWGKYDPFFTPAGALAYERDLPDAEIVWLEAGHFALETHAEDVSEHVLRFLRNKVFPTATR